MPSPVLCYNREQRQWKSNHIEPIVTVYITQLSKNSGHVALLAGLTFSASGLGPSINILVKKITPASLTGRVFGFNMSTGYLGVFTGSVLGGQVDAWLGIQYVFLLLVGCCL